ncbi:MAG: transcriptional regulator [Oligoflexia bacterium]|nr:transcriptional regulator [Oligoflexia bacterium]
MEQAPLTPASTESATDAVTQARLATDQATLMVADTVGDLMAFWNFKPSMGRVWAVLYLSQDPLGASEIAARTGLSAGSISMTLAELLRWGVIRREWQTGQRRKLYRAETDIVRMVTTVFRERELRLVDDAITRLELARRLLDDQGRSNSASQMLQGRFLATRIDGILRLARVGRRVVDQLANVAAVDLGPIRAALLRR